MSTNTTATSSINHSRSSRTRTIAFASKFVSFFVINKHNIHVLLFCVVIIRQRPPAPVTPPPIIIRERPPTPPSYTTPQVTGFVIVKVNAFHLLLKLDYFQTCFTHSTHTTPGYYRTFTSDACETS